MRRLNFQDHRRDLNNNRYVYAVVSRRVGGLSIGINLNPDKGCNFDCPYCQVDRTVPGGARAVDVDVLAAELGALLELVGSGDLWSTPPFDTAAEHLRRVGDISFAGDGEPTAARAFEAAVDRVAQIRAAHQLQDVPLTLLTNATLFHRSAVQAGLDRLWDAGGEVWGKLDAGTEAFFHQVDGTTLPFSRVLDNLMWAARKRPLVLQSMFHTWNGQAPPDAEIHAWAGRIEELVSGGGSIQEVQVYTVARAPADSRVGPLTDADLQTIADAIRVLVPRVQVYGAG